jgi:hypothetical protein
VAGPKSLALIKQENVQALIAKFGNLSTELDQSSTDFKAKESM